MIADHDLDRLLDRDRLIDRGSHGVTPTPLIVVGYRGPHQPDGDRDFDSLLDRAFALDCHHNRPLDSNQISMTRTLRPSYFKLMSQVPSFHI